MTQFSSSLCHDCKHCKHIKGRRSVFLLCEALPQKYFPQPVRYCSSFENKEKTDSTPDNRFD